MGQENNPQAGGRGGRSNLQAGVQLPDALQKAEHQGKGVFQNIFFKNFISVVVKDSSSKLHGLPRGENFPPLAGLNISADKWQTAEA